MKKMLIILLTIALSIGSISAQTIDGNYELDSLVVQYVTVVRDINQVGNDGNSYVTDYDANAATYSIRIGWPNANSAEFEYSLPYWDVGDTIGVLNVPLGSSAALTYYGLGLNTDFTSGSFTINEGSVYPTTNTEDCVTSQAFLPIQDAGTWTDGGYDPLITGDSYKWGWGIITSGVFATFSAPDFNNHVYGTDYGFGTAMENWGYIQANFTDETASTVDGLNIGWEAHDGPDADIGIVSDGDPYFDQAEADLGLLNGMVGRSAIPSDSVTIGAIAQYAASLDPPISINMPTDNPPYMLGGEGVTHPTTGEEGFGAFDSEWGYIFDPTGDLLGGGDGIPFSGDEGLAYTGYYATWNTLRTLYAITYGAGYGQATGATTGAEFAEAIMNAVYTQWYLDADSIGTIQVPIDNAGNVAPGVTVVQTVLTDSINSWAGQYMAAGMPAATAIIEAIKNTLPIVMGGLTTLETVAPGLFEDWDGDSVTVNDSWSDLESEYWWWFDNDDDGEDSAGDSLDANGNLLSRFHPVTGMASGTYMYGGRIYVQSYANCFPARWSQYIDSHWYNTANVSTVDDGIVADIFELKGNYPNPFNPTTKIRFSNDRSSHVTVTVYSLKGEKVITLMNKQVNSGTYDVTWNGNNSNGKVVPTGLYLYDIESGGRRLQGKMLFLK
jgi:hypothetical protein